MSIVNTYAMDQLSTLQQKVADEVNAGTYKLEEKEVVNSNDTDTDVDAEVVSAENQEKKENTAAGQTNTQSTETADTENQVQASDITEDDVVDYILAKHPNVAGIYATNSESLELALKGLERNEKDTDKLTIMGFDVNDTVKSALEDGVVDGVCIAESIWYGICIRDRNSESSTWNGK